MNQLRRLLVRRARRERFCAQCGRRIPAADALALLKPRPCTNCGSTLRRWETVFPGPVEVALAAWELYQFNRRRRLPAKGEIKP